MDVIECDGEVLQEWLIGSLTMSEHACGVR